MKRLLTTSATANGLRRVVVTGIGAQTPLGNTFDSTWNTLVSTDMTPEKGITTLEEALLIQNLPQDVLNRDLKNAKLIPSQVAAPVRDVGYDARTSRFVQFALHAAREAIEASKLSDHLGLHSQDTVSDDILYNRTRTGTCIASGMSSIREVVSNQDIMERKNSIRRISPHFVPKILCNAPSSRVSLDLHLHGPNLAPSTACAAGAHAIGEAFRSIQYGDADIMIAGGNEACIDPLSMAGFCRLKALSTRYNDDPIASSRPFDKDRDGFVMGEGCAIIILEELHHALERGAPILCEISGYGVSGDAYHVTSPDPDGKGAERAMQMALQRAGVKPSQVDYLNAVSIIMKSILSITIHQLLIQFDFLHLACHINTYGRRD